jgi:glyoxylase-like metal-dependent hydrolase (beta-lactamase superfamily II)
MSLKLTYFPCPPFATNTYLIWCSQTLDLAIVDPGKYSFPKIEEVLQANPLNPKMILLTHSHWDHIAGLAEVKEQLNLPVYVHREDVQNVRSPGADLLPLMFEIKGVEPEHQIEDHEILHLGKEKLEVIHTPGHTPGGVCYYDAASHMLLSGDTLFHGTIGNLSFPSCEPERMWASLKRLAALPPDTKVYPGHGEPTTIGAEEWLKDAEKIFGNR